MKKHILILICLSLALGLLFAHPAGKVSAAYDAKTQILKIDYDHKVSSAKDHFIYNITVQVNGKKTIEQVIFIQDNENGGSYSYKMLGLKKGDKINVITDCNKGGKKSSAITVP